jgi:hypothetical protein
LLLVFSDYRGVQWAGLGCDRPPLIKLSKQTGGLHVKTMMIVFLSVFASEAFAQTAPEPRSIVAKCNKEAGSIIILR